MRRLSAGPKDPVRPGPCAGPDRPAPAGQFLLRRLDHRATTAAAIVVAAIVVALPSADHAFGVGWTLYSAPPARFPEFVLGAALARLVLLGRWRGPGLGGALALAVTGYFAAAVTPTDFAFACCTLAGFGLLIPSAAVADLRGLPSMWRGRRLVRLGQLSFAFYMVHILVLHAATHLFTTRQLTIPQAAVAAAGVSATSLAAAWLLYEVVERPAQRLLLTRWRTGRDPGSGIRAESPSMTVCSITPPLTTVQTLHHRR